MKLLYIAPNRSQCSVSENSSKWRDEGAVQRSYDGLHRQLGRIWQQLPDIIINACLKPPNDPGNVSG